MTSQSSDLRKINAPRRGLQRVKAAVYVGISPTKFDEMVADVRMPREKRIDGRRVWDIRKLDVYYDALPDEEANQAGSRNPWDEDGAA